MGKHRLVLDIGSCLGNPRSCKKEAQTPCGGGRALKNLVNVPRVALLFLELLDVFDGFFLAFATVVLHNLV